MIKNIISTEDEKPKIQDIKLINQTVIKTTTTKSLHTNQFGKPLYLCKYF